MSFTEQKFFRASGVFSPARFFKPPSAGDAARGRDFASCARTGGGRLSFRILA
jgi:hypothetical protein